MSKIYITRNEFNIMVGDLKEGRTDMVKAWITNRAKKYEGNPPLIYGKSMV